MAGKRRKRKTQYPDEFLKAKDLLTAARQLLVVGTPQQVSSMTREQLQAFKQEVARAKFRRKWAWLHEEAALLRTTSFSEGVPPEVSERVAKLLDSYARIYDRIVQLEVAKRLTKYVAPERVSARPAEPEQTIPLPTDDF